MKASRAPRTRHTTNTALRSLPAIEKLLESPELIPEITLYTRPLVIEATRHVLSELRDRIREGTAPRGEADLPVLIRTRLLLEWPGFMSGVINGTGIILHTNLGRAPLSQKALEAVSNLGGQYFNLEADLKSGGRGTRASELRRLIALLTGAEDAVAVNNNAAAVLLVLVAMANGREAIVSRGELVQIGGGFRVPEIMEQSGVKLREIGTTNHTTRKDYARAINEHTAMILKIHQSNFVQNGFVGETSLSELSELAAEHNVPLIYDLGSGAVIDTAEFGLKPEPTVQQALRDGADLVCFSGDKLFGGPQAGIIAGKRKLIEPLLNHPLMRAVRLDKLSAIALEATAAVYLNRTATLDIPSWRMMSYDLSALRLRARAIVRKLKACDIRAEIKEGLSMVGGGTLPEQSLSTALVSLTPTGSAEACARSLRLSQPPLIARIENDHILIDMRTVFPEQDDAVAKVVQRAMNRKN